METYYWSSSKSTFLSSEYYDQYQAAGSWPSDAVVVSNDVFQTYTQNPPDGKKRADVNGMPGWVDIPAESNATLYQIALNALSEAYKTNVASLSSAYASAALTDGTSQTSKQAALQSQYATLKTQFASDIAALKTKYGV